MKINRIFAFLLRSYFSLNMFIIAGTDLFIGNETSSVFHNGLNCAWERSEDQFVPSRNLCEILAVVTH